MSIEPTQPDTITPDPGVTPEIPPVKLPPRRDPADGKVILNPDGTLHLGEDGSATLHSRTADPCCPEVVEPADPCGFCASGTTPRSWGLTLSGVTPCTGCFGPFIEIVGGSDPNGYHVLEQLSGCRWLKEGADGGEIKLWSQEGCSGILNGSCELRWQYTFAIQALPGGGVAGNLLVGLSIEIPPPCIVFSLPPRAIVFDGIPDPECDRPIATQNTLITECLVVGTDRPAAGTGGFATLEPIL